MAQHRQGARTLALGLAAALLAPIALAASAGAAPSAKRIDADSLRGRTGHVVTGKAGEAKAAPKATKASPSLKARSKPTMSASGGGTVTRSLAGPLAGTTSDSSTAVAASSCTLDQVWVNTLADRSVVHIAQPGSTSLTLQRLRDGGSWRTVATVNAAAGVVNDNTVNQRVGYQYRLIAKSGTTVALDCITDGYYGTWTEDGFGYAEAVVAGTTGIFQQGVLDQGNRVLSSRWASPAFSTDGRLYAATKIIDSTTGRAVLEVHRAANAALVFSVDLGTTEFPGDPAFSPDGQTMAYTRYEAATGYAKGLGFVDIFGSHTKRALNTASPVGEPSWRPDGVSLVVTDFRDGAGLATVSSTGTAVTPIAGTTGGFTPEVGIDGTIWFTTASDTSSELKRRATSGAVATLRSSTTDSYIWPRVAPDGTLYVEKDTPDPVDPNAYSMAVYTVAPTGAADDTITSIGWEVEDTNILGWDVRQPQSKGTSDFVADAHHDLVARDANGVLWAYRNSLGYDLNGRTQIGSGWKGFNAVVAVGDLNGDDQADLVGRDAAGTLWLYRGKPTGGFYARTQLGTGWNSFYLVATGDFNGDDKADLISRDSKGVLWLYPGTGRGTLSARVQIGSGWGIMNSIIGTGDVDYDAKADLMARDTAGRLWLYPGNGKGGFLARRQVGSGWGGFTAITTTEVTYGTAQVWARTSAGELRGYVVTGDGKFLSGGYLYEGTGWKPFLLTS
ncbi:FG-GAP-like repeat-containing protein [Intrasporangium mesophilum]